MFVSFFFDGTPQRKKKDRCKNDTSYFIKIKQTSTFD